ncbi:glycoside hydrolase family 108 protein [Methylobacterium sp. MA0201]|uniref:glycoside hydrolase family 108 protein n=1 Tax=Methylobacterium alsaeris TaxID=3344826 RepID=UPI0037575EF1
MAASNATTAITRILAHEAGYVNNPKDPGGPTNRGITQATLAAWRGHPVTKADVRALPEAEAVAIYRAEYWDRVHGDALPGGLDYAVVDFGVNSGVGRANRYLQSVLKARKLYAGDIDGVVGAKTLAAIGGLTPAVVAAVIRDLCAMRLRYLKSLDGWPTFGKGWSRRVSEVQAAALALAAGTYAQAEADLPDPVPTVRGAPVQVAATRTVTGKAAAVALLGVVGDQASSYAGTFQTLSDIAPVFRYLFAACTVIGVLTAIYKAWQLAKGAEAAPPKPTAPEAANDDVPAVEPASAEPVSEKSDPPAAAPVAA